MPDYDDFLDKYPLETNHIDPNAAFDGNLFETFGAEWDFIELQPCDKVWTLTESDGSLNLTLGFHFINRVGYFLAKDSHVNGDPEQYTLDDFDN